MRIFIDTNKYLDFYRASDHSLSRLDTLVDLISKNKVEVIVPEQVYSEFLRDKEIVYQEFVKSNFIEIKIPGFLKGDKAIYRVNKSIEKIKLNYDKKFFSTKSKINQTFKKFFEAAGIVNETPEIVQRAYFRTLKGNPPRKGNRSFGDAIIWETLLEKFSDKELVIVSGDGDWSSEINKSVINPFLLHEWIAKNNKKVELFDNLGALLNKITKKPKIKTEIIEEEKQLDKYASTRYLNNYDNLINRESVMNLGNLVADSRLISPTLNSFYNQDLLATQINLSRTCVCCGESFVSSDYTLSVYGNRCEKCQDIMSIGKNCSECGKHYHYSYLAVSSAVPSFSMSGQNLCPDCSERKGKSSIYQIPGV